MEVKICWKNGKKFEGSSQSGAKIIMDIPLERQGTNEGPTPKEVFLMSAAGCTGLDVVSILEKKRLEITSFEMVVIAEEDPEVKPKVFSRAKLHYIIKGKNLTKEAVEQAINLSQEKYCGVSAMMKKAFTFEHTYEFHNI